MRLPCSVTSTCTSPYSLLATGPSITRVAPGAVVVGAVVDPPELRRGADVVVVDGAAVVVAVSATGLVWKFASRKAPPAVAARTGMARRIVPLSTRIVRSGRDGGARRVRRDGGGARRPSEAGR